MQSLKISSLDRIKTFPVILQFILLACVSFGLFFGVVSVKAQAVEADVDFFAVLPENNAPYYVGDRITLRLQVTHPVGAQIDMFPIEEQWGDFEVVDQTGWRTVENDNGSATTSRDLVVSLFEPGQYETPPVVIEHQQPDGSVEELSAPVIRLKIDSILQEDDNELRDIKEQAILPVPPIWPYVLAGLLTALLVVGALVGGGLWFYHRWRHQALAPELPLPVFDARPPEVIAFAELDRIESLDLPAQGDFKEHYTLVTDCLRRYIEGRYRIPALDRTTSEIGTAFEQSSAPLESVREFMILLSQSDLVKFARLRPDPAEAYDLVDEARHVVKVTTPVPEPANDIPRIESELERERLSQ